MNYEKMDKAIANYINSKERNAKNEDVDLFMKQRVWDSVEPKSKNYAVLWQVAAIFLFGLFAGGVGMYQHEITNREQKILVLTNELNMETKAYQNLSDSVSDLKLQLAYLANRPPVVKEVIVNRYIENAVADVVQQNYANEIVDAALMKPLTGISAAYAIGNPVAEKDEIEFTTSITDSIKSLVNEGEYCKYTISYGKADITKGYTERPWKFTMNFN